MYTESERVRERERDSKRGTQCIFLFPSRSGKRRGTGLRMGGKRRGRREKRWTKERGEKAEKRA